MLFIVLHSKLSLLFVYLVVSIYPKNSTHFIENMTIICNIPVDLKVYDVQWQRNGKLFSNDDVDFAILSDNMLTLVHMEASSTEYICTVSIADNSSLTSPPLMVYKYSELCVCACMHMCVHECRTCVCLDGSTE